MILDLCRFLKGQIQHFSSGFGQIGLPSRHLDHVVQGRRNKLYDSTGIGAYFIKYGGSNTLVIGQHGPQKVDGLNGLLSLFNRKGMGLLKQLLGFYRQFFKIHNTPPNSHYFLFSMS